MYTSMFIWFFAVQHIWSIQNGALTAVCVFCTNEPYHRVDHLYTWKDYLLLKKDNLQL